MPHLVDALRHLADALRRPPPVGVQSTASTAPTPTAVAGSLQDVGNAPHAHPIVAREPVHPPGRGSNHDSLIARFGPLNLNDTSRRSEAAPSSLESGESHVESLGRHGPVAARSVAEIAAESGTTPVAIRAQNQAPESASQTVSIPIEVLRQHAWSRTVQSVADIAFLIGERGVRPEQWRSSIRSLQAGLELFQRADMEGMGLPPDDRRKFGALLEGPVVDGLSLRKVAQLWDSGAGKFSGPSGREQLAGFISRVQQALDMESVPTSPDALHQHWLRSAIQAIADVASLATHQPEPDPDRWDAAVDAMFVCLEHFADVESGGLWCSPEGRTALDALIERPIEDEPVLDETARRRETRLPAFDVEDPRPQIAGFLHRARAILATHVRNLDDDTKRALLWNPQGPPAP